jgi:hypothetical protein
MANLISLHTRQVFLEAGSPAAFGFAYFSLSGTETQVPIYADEGLATQRSSPVRLDANGVLPPCYTALGEPLRVNITDVNGTSVRGYPMDNIVPLIASELDASGTSFSPTDDIPETNVQDAIETVAALFSNQGSNLARNFTPYTTGGTVNAYTITPFPPVIGYEPNQSFLVRPDRANQGAATLDVNGNGARPLKKVGPTGAAVELDPGEIQPYREFQAVYDGSSFMMVSGRDHVHGSNSNGRYWQFGRLLLCWATPYSDLLAATTFVTNTWTFPRPFATTPLCWHNVRRNTSEGEEIRSVAIGEIQGAVAQLNTTSARFVVRNNLGTGRTVHLDTFAIGWVY